PALRAAIEASRVHAAILGDRHSTTQVARGIWYPGAPEVTDRREVDPGNVLVVDVDRRTRAVDVEVARTGTWTFATVEADLMDAADVAELADRLSAMPDKDRTAVWLKVGGTLTTRAKARLDQVIDEAGDLF